MGPEEDGGNMFSASSRATAALNSARASTRALGTLNRGLREAGASGGGKKSCTRRC